MFNDRRWQFNFLAFSFVYLVFSTFVILASLYFLQVICRLFVCIVCISCEPSTSTLLSDRSYIFDLFVFFDALSPILVSLRSLNLALFVTAVCFVDISVSSVSCLLSLLHVPFIVIAVCWSPRPPHVLVYSFSPSFSSSSTSPFSLGGGKCDGGLSSYIILRWHHCHFFFLCNVSINISVETATQFINSVTRNYHTTEG